MVRSNTPHPFLFRFRSTGGGKTSDAPAALPAKQLRRNKPKAAPLPSGQEAWREFVKRYEEFTDLLCVAAKDGVTESRENGYAELRRWFLENYPRVSPRLYPFLVRSGACVESAVVMVDPSSGRRRPLDGFEIVFLSSTLEELLRRDCGGLIDQVSRLSDAVYECNDSLMAELP